VSIGKQRQLTPLPLALDGLPAQILRATVIEDLRPVAAGPDAIASPVLEVEGLTARKGDRMLLEDITFQAWAGECLAIVGANGAGKTTLLRHIMGLERPAAGSIRLQGRDTRKQSVAQIAAQVGLAFQNPDNQFFRLSVREEIETGPKSLNTYDEAWIQTLVARFRLTPYLDRAPYRLSGGEKKRVAFASALAARPAVLALDEPTAGQDHHFRRALLDLLADVCSQGLLVILVTHDLAFAEACADRWILMNAGRMLADAAPWTVMGDQAAMARAGLAPTDRFILRAARSQGTGYV
jgi:energy-coupling factor transport system ATP-binding protein